MTDHLTDSLAIPQRAHFVLQDIFIHDDLPSLEGRIRRVRIGRRSSLFRFAIKGRTVTLVPLVVRFTSGR
jgi:hypothetical protein